MTEPLRFDDLAGDLLERLDSGQRLDLPSLRRRYPQFARDIETFFTVERLLRLSDAPGRALVPALGGDYRLLRLIGQGGMGKVYEAHQLSLGRKVALKVLERGHLASDESLQRFRREAQAQAQLRHPNIVPIYAWGEDPSTDVAYIAMEYVEGRTLAEVVQALGGPEGTPPTETRLLEVVGAGGGAERAPHHRLAARWAAELADALEHAHSRRVIHRDIKPGNIMIRPEATPVIMDFGVALCAGAPTITVTGQFVGSPAYMSPEQLSGKQVDQRTDIYSLGASLFELLTLHRPFEADLGEALRHQVLLGRARPLRELDPRIHRDLERIVRKAMAREADDRYQSASELAEDLRRFLTNEPVQARAPGSLTRVAKLLRRHRTKAALGLAAAVLLGIWAPSLLSPRGGDPPMAPGPGQIGAGVSESVANAGARVADSTARLREDAISEGMALVRLMEGSDPEAAGEVAGRLLRWFPEVRGRLQAPSHGASVPERLGPAARAALAKIGTRLEPVIDELAKAGLRAAAGGEAFRVLDLHPMSEACGRILEYGRDPVERTWVHPTVPRFRRDDLRPSPYGWFHPLDLGRIADAGAPSQGAAGLPTFEFPILRLRTDLEPEEIRSWADGVDRALQWMRARLIGIPEGGDPGARVEVHVLRSEGAARALAGSRGVRWNPPAGTWYSGLRTGIISIESVSPPETLPARALVQYVAGHGLQQSMFPIEAKKPFRADWILEGLPRAAQLWSPEHPSDTRFLAIFRRTGGLRRVIERLERGEDLLARFRNEPPSNDSEEAKWFAALLADHALHDDERWDRFARLVGIVSTGSAEPSTIEECLGPSAEVSQALRGWLATTR